MFPIGKIGPMEMFILIHTVSYFLKFRFIRLVQILSSSEKQCVNLSLSPLLLPTCIAACLSLTTSLYISVTYSL